jgi:hypothetical protein
MAQQNLIELWGIRYEWHQHKIGGSFEREVIRELLATFTLEAEAKRYVRESELKASGKGAYWDIQRGKHRFRKGSLLREFNDYELMEHHPLPRVPHNPILEKK